jgi:mannose-6-phosphate isomerase
LEDKIWGSRSLQPYFKARSEDDPALGEAWLTYEESIVENGAFKGKTVCELMDLLGSRLTGDAYQARGCKRVSADEAAESDVAPKTYFPILTKLLFTSDVLSVQVHPPDAWALEHAGGPGKTEMWYVVDAEPGARVALGLDKTLSREELADSARSGAIEGYLHWVPVKEGDVIFVPAGLLHTLGAGLKICEIQQNSDLTYRFWDFNRPGPDGKPRKLHIEDGATVTDGAPWSGAAAPLALRSEDLDRRLLAACPYFAAELLSWTSEFDFRTDAQRFLILVILEGTGTLADEAYGPGTTFLIPAHADKFRVQARKRTRAVCAYEPDLKALRRGLEDSGASAAEIEGILHP